jgi:hypothetical protein
MATGRLVIPAQAGMTRRGAVAAPTRSCRQPTATNAQGKIFERMECPPSTYVVQEEDSRPNGFIAALTNS